MEKHIKIPWSSINYPVGKDFSGIRTLCEYYSHAFIEYVKEGETTFNLWCRGSSGAILASCFAMMNPQYNFIICHVKKYNEDSHSSSVPTYFYDNCRNIVIDDFVSSGDTIRHIVEAIKNVDEVSDCLMVARGALYESKGLKDLFKTIICNS